MNKQEVNLINAGVTGIQAEILIRQLYQCISQIILNLVYKQEFPQINLTIAWVKLFKTH